MSKQFIEDPIKIYLKDSDKVKLADWRVRIVRETSPRSPEDNEDLVFVRVSSKDNVPKNALHSWKLENNGPGDTAFFWTNEARCKKMVSDNPADYTEEKLKYFEKVERRLWTDWLHGNVYGYVVEKWDAKRREWMHTSSLWGMYGAKDLFDNLATETDGVSIPVCIDNEDMKYDFKNVEMKPNQFE